MTRIAVGLMVDTLRQEGRPMSMVQLYRAGIGYPGPDHRFEPRHWFWALQIMPGFLISLDEDTAGKEGVLDGDTV